MLHQHAHLAAEHLTWHTNKINTIISRNSPNTTQEENVTYLTSR